MLNLKTIIITIVSLAVIGIAYNAFAHGAMGWDGGWGHHGQGRHPRGDYGLGYDDQMSKDEYKQLEQKRAAFFKETRDLRANLYEKEREQQKELAKNDRDSAKASVLQKEISELQTQFDKKRIDHMVEIRELTPNAGRGYLNGGPMMGYGARGGGYCR